MPLESIVPFSLQEEFLRLDAEMDAQLKADPKKNCCAVHMILDEFVDAGYPEMADVLSKLNDNVVTHQMESIFASIISATHFMFRHLGSPKCDRPELAQDPDNILSLLTPEMDSIIRSARIGMKLILDANDIDRYTKNMFMIQLAANAAANGGLALKEESKS